MPGLRHVLRTFRRNVQPDGRIDGVPQSEIGDGYSKLVEPRGEVPRQERPAGKSEEENRSANAVFRQRFIVGLEPSPRRAENSPPVRTRDSPADIRAETRTGAGFEMEPLPRVFAAEVAHPRHVGDASLDALSGALEEDAKVQMRTRSVRAPMVFFVSGRLYNYLSCSNVPRDLSTTFIAPSVCLKIFRIRFSKHDNRKESPLNHQKRIASLGCLPKFSSVLSSEFLRNVSGAFPQIFKKTPFRNTAAAQAAWELQSLPGLRPSSRHRRATGLMESRRDETLRPFPLQARQEDRCPS